MMKKLIKILSIFCSVFIAFSCVDDSLNSSDNKEDAIQLTLLVNAPKPSIVRAADTSPDAQIDFQKLKIYLFGENGFVNTVEFEQTPMYNDSENAYEVKIKLPKDNTIVDLVLVTNPNNEDPIVGMSKSDFYKNTTYAIEGKWDIVTKKIPFWGEIKGLKLDDYAGTKYKDKIKVSLIRSLARIDFIVNEPDNKDNAKAHKTRIKLKDVYVYRSLNKANLVPDPNNFDSGNNKTTAPTVPNGASYNFDNVTFSEMEITVDNEKPLYYKHTIFKQITDYSINSMIYLPEQINSGDATVKPLFLVIGAVFGADEKTTYYRIDLKEKDNSGKIMDILRNHNYIITINGAVGPGYETPKIAAAQGASNIDVDIVKWDNGINEAYIFGDKYFGINSSDIIFEDYKEGQTYLLKYQTNIPENEIVKMLEYSFRDNIYFSAKLDAQNKQIIITTLKDNDTGKGIVEDLLTIHCVTKEFKVNVRQKPNKVDYYLVCDETEVKGVYQKNIAMNENNYILVTAEADADLTGNFYEIHTNEIDGLSFSASGNFTMTLDDATGKYREQIKLVGSGTAVTSMKKELTIIPNSLNYATCNATVKMALGPKKILGFHHGTTFGYSTNVGYSKIFREDEGNFGLTVNSVIKVPPLTNFASYDIDIIDTRNEVNAFANYLNEKPDIIIWGFNSRFSETIYGRDAAKLLADYVKKNGTLIMMCERTETNAMFFQALYEGEGKNLNITSTGVTGAGTCYPFINLPNDPISDGPFGSTNGQEWGEDASTTTAVAGLPEEDLIIYSRSIPTKREKSFYDQGVTICRHKKYNLVFIGDAGFISQGGSLGNYTSQTICPFMINRQQTGNSKIPGYENLPLNYPIPKKFGNTDHPNTPVYNSVFFANSLAWALERAEFHGINSAK